MAATFGFAVATSAPELARAFGDLARKQLPFATAVALTRLAQDAQTRVRDGMASKFKLHGNRLVRGVQIKRAEKRDWPDVRAVVGDRDEFMVLQETGGERRAEKGGGSHVAIPTKLVTSRRTSAGRPPKALKPKALLANKRAHARRIAGEAIVARLTGKKSATGRPEQLTYWLLRKSARIKPVFRFRETVTDTAEDRFRPVFERELTAAVKSARVRNMKLSSEYGRLLYLRAVRSIA